MPLDTHRARQALATGDLRGLFIEALGWDRHNATLEVMHAGAAKELHALAQKRGMVAWHFPTLAGQRLPDYAERRKIEHQVARSAHEHLIVFTDAAGDTQIWQWVKREMGKPAAYREHTFHRSQPGDALLQKLDAIAFALDEEERISLIDVTRRARAGFDVERVTKRFYDRFQKEHATFLKFITGITDAADREWYASVMLNRLMFVYFIQRKGFLDGDRHYLRNRLVRMRADHGKDTFYSFYRHFLLRLFHEGLGGRVRTARLDNLLGRIPFLNGGLFDIHELERPESYGKAIQIPDSAFERIFDYFDQYQWHLDERPFRADNEINPDVLGYIFEKYINQKQMGAYYTKEDITEYISRNTLLPFLFNAARAKCTIAFDNPKGPTVWDLLRADPDRYIYAALRHGSPAPLPDEITAGYNPPTLHQHVRGRPVQSLELRRGWNRPAPPECALPAETWREVVTRRKRYCEVRAKLAAGEVRAIDDLITFNLDTRQFAQDVIENCEGPELLRAFWNTIEKVTILDPTCGSGAFLFASLNILELLYEACILRMEAFVADLDRSGEQRPPEKFSDFRKVLATVSAHPNRRYFIFKSIILNNLYGVDIMEEAVEICKLRLFLKLAAQVEPETASVNLGIEPLPDIDFNIRAGNTLVGYTTPQEVLESAGGDWVREQAVEKIQAMAAELQLAFDTFRSRQLQGDESSAPTENKHHLRARLSALGEELNRYLATEFGVTPSKKDAFAKWLKSYQPFHWFEEFYKIMNGGGFDVVVGNPPYLEYSKVKNYRVRNYATEASANLYAFTVERSFALASKSGRVGMIVPISLACSGAMESLRDHLTQTSRSLWLSHFSNRPGQLFTGAQNRLTIFLSSGRQSAPNQFSTRYHRWNAKDGERESLFPTLRYQALASEASMFHGLLPKVGCPEAASLVKISSNKTVELFTSRRGPHRIYWVRVPGYFCQFLSKPPMARPETGGGARVRGEVQHIAFDAKSDCRVCHAVLNSSTYYQFFCTYTDTRHINPSNVAEFPLDLSRFDERTKGQLGELSAKLTKCFASHTGQSRKSGLLIDSIDTKACKPILDEIDMVLADHYGFTEEELDFIINYDIKYRTGRDARDQDE